MANLEMDVVKSLESLNEEIRDTLPWTTPAPGLKILVIMPGF